MLEPHLVKLRMLAVVESLTPSIPFRKLGVEMDNPEPSLM
jgi:hypothetical protein